MGRLLEELRADSATRKAANPANPANCPAPVVERFANSQDSQPVDQATRVGRITLVVAEEINVALIDRTNALVARHTDLTDDELRACLPEWGFGARMDAGVPPAGYTHAAQCIRCGPVLLRIKVSARLVACPWCFRRRAGKPIPRPNGELADKPVLLR